MNTNNTIIELIERKILEEYKKGNKYATELYQELLIDIYKTMEKQMIVH